MQGNAYWIAIGVGVGVALGVALDNIGVWLAIGTAFGVVMMAIQSQRGSSDAQRDETDEQPHSSDQE